MACLIHLVRRGSCGYCRQCLALEPVDRTLLIGHGTCPAAGIQVVVVQLNYIEAYVAPFFAAPLI